ncbi:MAG: glycine zipper domain-containing protein [Gammaproteobacteria bacterium]|jgi:hypothetical protein
MRNLYVSLAMFFMLSLPAVADDDNLTMDAAIGGAIGGAAGGAIGAQVGGRDGAIAGAGVGAVVGTAVNTRDYKDDDHDGYGRDGNRRDYDYYHSGYFPSHPNGRFCPPGQAKKGRC